MAKILYNEQDPNPPRMHIQVRKGEIGEYVILPGDPGRCKVIAEFLEDAKLVAQNREHITYTGRYKGVRVSVISTGMGCPSAAIAAEEAFQCGAKVLIRLGGGLLLQPDKIKAGDVAITLGSMKCEGTTSAFVPDSFPAAADPDVVIALIRSAQKFLQDTGFAYHTGITATIDAFYGETPEMLDRFRKLGIINVEMESAAIFTVAQQHGIRAGCICACGNDDNTEDGTLTRNSATARQIKITLEAIRLLDEMRAANCTLLQEGDI